MGTTTGYGLSYCRWFDKNAIAITCLPLIDKNNTYYSLGISYFREIKQYKTKSFFLFLGNHLTNTFSEKGGYLNNIGIGPGMEWFVDDFVTNFMIGYGIYAIPQNIMMRPTIEVGIYFNF